jgi:hypothetical protein
MEKRERKKRTDKEVLAEYEAMLAMLKQRRPDISEARWREQMGPVSDWREQMDAAAAVFERLAVEWAQDPPGPTLTDAELGLGPDEACAMEVAETDGFFTDLADAEAQAPGYFRGAPRVRVLFRDGVYYLIVPKEYYERLASRDGPEKTTERPGQ